MISWNLVKIGPGNGLLSDSTKPLPETMFTNHWLGFTVTWGQIHRKCSRYLTSTNKTCVLWQILTWAAVPEIRNAASQIAKFMGPTWGPCGSCWPQMGPMLAPWTLLSGIRPLRANLEMSVGNAKPDHILALSLHAVYNINGIVQVCNISIAKALEIPQFSKPSISCLIFYVIMEI